MTFTDHRFWILTGVTFVAWLFLRRHYWPTLALFLVANLVYYGHDVWWLIFLIGSYCVVDYGVGLAIERTRYRRAAMGLGVGFNLVVLAFWKYTPLVLSTLAARVGWETSQHVSTEGWIIPAGISFYAFTGIAYIIDVYRGDVAAERSLLRYVVYITFFPHLVAGPILRSNEFLDELQPSTLPSRTDHAGEAIYLVALGMFKKMVLADRIAIAIDPFFAHVADDTTSGVWALPHVYLYAMQIYFDFSGYTDIARGLGLMFGFRWPDNFRSPYLADSVQDFWRRWHLTLSRFLRDYLYVALGGNRKGRLRTHVNIMLTMLLGGLWHGASWSFLVWGGLHGVYLVIHRLWSETPVARALASAPTLVRGAWRGVAIALTFHCVCLAWCFFRLTDFWSSVACVRKCVSFEATSMFVGPAADLSIWAMLALYAAYLGVAHWVGGWKKNSTGDRLIVRYPQPFPAGIRWGLTAGLLVLAIVLSPGGKAPPFIYFQF